MTSIVKAFSTWSGGKDSCLAFYKALKSGLDVELLLNMIAEDGEFSRSHGVHAKVLQEQAKAIGREILQIKTSKANYEENFKKALLMLRENGFTHGIFGDIDLQEHKEWIERVCGFAGISPLLPLWKMDHEAVVKEFIALGFRAVVCSVKKGVLETDWLGREIDFDFIHEMKRRSLDVCGERGEFHTFVYDGPIFKRALKLKFGNILFRNGYYFIEIKI